MSSPPGIGSWGDRPGSGREPHPGCSGLRGCRVVWIALGAVAVVALVVIAVAVGSVIAGDTENTGEHRAGELSGDRRAWAAAVCAPGSMSRPSSANFRFPDARNSAFCSARSQPGGAPVSLLIGEWPADVALDRIMAPYRSVHYAAAGNSGDRTVVFAAIDSTDRAVLEPLAAFGFTVTALG